MVPAGAQTGKLLRLRKKGLAALQSHDKGDLLVRLKVETPTRLSAEEKALFAKLQEIDSSKKSDSGKGFFNRARDAMGI